MEDKKTKDSTLILLAIVGIFLVMGSGFTIPQIDFGQFDPFAGFAPAADTGKVNVEKPIDFVLINHYAGSGLGTKTLLVYDSDGSTQLESCTTAADGTIATVFPYDSGDLIYVYYESSNDKQWWPVTVPQMNPLDAEATTVNTVRLDSFAIGTYTSDTLKHEAYTVADAGTYNFTTNGTLMSFTYSLANTGNDNTGLMSSYDPTYEMKYSPVMYMTISGTEYEKILVYGFDYDYTLGTTHYTAKELDAYALTKHKVGNIYKSMGTQDVTFTLDGSGYSAGASSVTVQIYVYAYSDPNYSMNHGGAYGPEAVQIAEHTMTLHA